jgi:hypothetical protein
VSTIIVFTDPSSGDFSSVTTDASGGWNSVAYGNDYFVGVGNDEWFVYDEINATIAKYGDGTNVLGNFTSVAYGNNVFVASIDVSGDDTNGNLYYSTDYGVTWNPNEGIDGSGGNVTDSNWKLVKYVPVIDGGYFSAFAISGSSNYTDSSGGIYWNHTKATGQINTFTDLAAGYSTTDFSANYVLVGNADPSYNIAFSNSVVENCINIGNNNQNGHNNSIAIGNNIVVGKDNIIKLGGNEQELIIGNNLGVGEVDAPQTRLHLSDNITESLTTIDYNLCITYENTAGYDWRLGPYIDPSGEDKFSLFCGSGLNNMTPYLTFDISGNVGIGTTSPQQTLDVSGQVQAVSFNATSDFRLKNDIKPLELCLDKVCNLQGVEFVRKGDEDKKYIGFIAQEIEKIVPEVVTTANDENGYKSVAYGNVTALLVEAVKELRQEVKDLRAEIQSYK